MKVYVLEWGLDSHYSTNVGMLTNVFPTLEDACSRAMEYSVKPNIVVYDLITHTAVKEYTDIPALDASIGA